MRRAEADPVDAPSLWSLEGRVLAGALRRWAPAAPVVEAHPNWDVIVSLAARHRVEGQLAASPHLDTLAPPPRIRRHLAVRARVLALEALQLLNLQLRAVHALRAHALDVIVLKGVPLGLEAFGDLTLRSGGDVDILVAPRDVSAAARVLEGMGLAWRGWKLPDPHSTPLDRGPELPVLMEAVFVEGSQCLELHWRLGRNMRLLPVDPAWLRTPRLIDVQGTPTPVLPVVPSLLYLAVHGTLHRWQRLKWLVDIPALVLSCPGLLATPVLEEATRRGVDRCLATGLLLAERVLGPFLTAEARAWASSVTGTAVLLRQSAVALGETSLAPRPIEPHQLAGQLIGRLSVRRELAYRLEELRLMLIEAGQQHTTPAPGRRALASAPFVWAVRQRWPASDTHRPHVIVPSDED